MLTHCTPHGQDDLAQRLAAQGYRSLISEQSEVGRELWNDGANAAALSGIAMDSARPLKVRFLALELAWAKTGQLPGDISQSVAASLLVAAIAHTPLESENWGLSGNEWGFLWYMDVDGIDGARTLGQHLITLGDAALPPLVGLLDDTAPVEYEGSKEGMVGNGLGYRVQDVAAYFIGRITREPIPFEKDMAKRDAAITSMRARLRK